MREKWLDLAGFSFHTFPPASVSSSENTDLSKHTTTFWIGKKHSIMTDFSWRNRQCNILPRNGHYYGFFLLCWSDFYPQSLVIMCYRKKMIEHCFLRCSYKFRQTQNLTLHTMCKPANSSSSPTSKSCDWMHWQWPCQSPSHNEARPAKRIIKPVCAQTYTQKDRKRKENKAKSILPLRALCKTELDVMQPRG